MWGVFIGILVQKEAFTQFAINALTMIDMLNEENIESNVSYREQTSWLYLFAMSLTFGPYLVWMAICLRVWRWASQERIFLHCGYMRSHV